MRQLVLLTAALALVACERADDLDVAVAPVVQGAPIDASLTEAVFTLDADVTAAQVNGLLRQAAEGPLKGILGYEERPLVSADYTSDPRSGIVDAPSTMVVVCRMVKISIWYDNEYGYANRLVELAARVGELLE